MRQIHLYSKNLMALVILGLFLFGCTKKDHPVVGTGGKTMGTTYSVKYVVDSKEASKKNIRELIDKKLIEVNQSMSTYIPSSEISKFNTLRTTFAWVPISKEFRLVLEHALELAKKTNGVFDPTIGPLVNLWGFGPKREKRIPSPDQIDEVKKAVGFEKVVFNDKRDSIRKLHKEVYLDLSASAKGYGVDAIANLLKENGIENFMVEIGGEVVVSGQKNKENWTIGIVSPSSDGKPVQKILRLKNVAMATSGDYLNYFEKDGKKYSHTINHKSGSPVESNLTSVTVIDKNSSCMNADALATALMAMGTEKAREFATKENIAAFMIVRKKSDNTFREITTPAFDELMGDN